MLGENKYTAIIKKVKPKTQHFVGAGNYQGTSRTTCVTSRPLSQLKDWLKSSFLNV